MWSSFLLSFSLLSSLSLLVPSTLLSILLLPLLFTYCTAIWWILHHKEGTSWPSQEASQDSHWAWESKGGEVEVRTYVVLSPDPLDVVCFFCTHLWADSSGSWILREHSLSGKSIMKVNGTSPCHLSSSPPSLPPSLPPFLRTSGLSLE